MPCIFYPKFEVSSKGRIIPELYLPRGYKELLRNFYSLDRNLDVEKFARDLESSLKCPEIRLIWDGERGLTNISLGGGSGLDLGESGLPKFIEHNLGGVNSFITASVAMKYISKLLE
jgi:hypothetical protein